MTDQEILAVPEVAQEMRRPGIGYFSTHVAAAFRAGVRHAFPEPAPCRCGEMPDVHMWKDGGRWRVALTCLECDAAPRAFDEAEDLRHAYAGAVDMWEEAVEVVR